LGTALPILKEEAMTDNDIIKALEMCTSCGCIESCPMFFNGTDSTSNCRYALLGKALTLINRQKAEIERLSSDRYLLKEDGTMMLLPRTDVTKIKAEAIKEFEDRILEKAMETGSYFAVKSIITSVKKEMVGERE
jgi:hypothetical protein